MKKLILLLIIAVGCSTPPEPCTCTGKFKLNYDEGPEFYNVWTDVDCETGEPFLSLNADQMVIYLGCDYEFEYQNQ